MKSEPLSDDGNWALHQQKSFRAPKPEIATKHQGTLETPGGKKPEHPWIFFSLHHNRAVASVKYGNSFCLPANSY